LKCLILGGAGFLGSHLCDGLLKAGHAIRVFDRVNVARKNVAHILNRIEFVEGDFSDQSYYAEILAGVDVVFHLISTTVPKTSNENPAYDVASNIVSTLQFLDCVRAGGVEKIVFFSSGGTAYGIPKDVPIQEDHPTRPICSYGIHKITIENYLHLYHHLYGLDYTIVRISNPYGIRQRPTGLQGVVAAFINRALKKEPLEIWGDGSVIRDYVYVTDVINAVLAVLRYRGAYRLFNIGSGIGISLMEVAKTVERRVGYPLDLTFIPAGHLHVPVNILDNRRARRELDWHPTLSFEDGIAKVIKSERTP
jgi:UDP-glucose 4-epimerase